MAFVPGPTASRASGGRGPFVPVGDTNRDKMGAFCPGPAREPPKKKENKKKTKEAPIKPWDLSIEECDRRTAERVKEHFKPKPEPEKVINPIDLKFFKGMCEANKRKFIPIDPPSDYERTIIKTTEKKEYARTSMV